MQPQWLLHRIAIATATAAASVAGGSSGTIGLRACVRES